MKKAKIMLVAIAVLATVGTSLAFKVKKGGSTQYCYITTTVLPPTSECNVEVRATAELNSGTPTFFYDEKIGLVCGDDETCDKQGDNFDL